jgi:hypothetical protein
MRNRNILILQPQRQNDAYIYQKESFIKYKRKIMITTNSPRCAFKPMKRLVRAYKLPRRHMLQVSLKQVLRFPTLQQGRLRHLSTTACLGSRPYVSNGGDSHLNMEMSNTRAEPSDETETMELPSADTASD